jgi:hypothetical protein
MSTNGTNQCPFCGFIGQTNYYFVRHMNRRRPCRINAVNRWDCRCQHRINEPSHDLILSHLMQCRLYNNLSIVREMQILCPNETDIEHIHVEYTDYTTEDRIETASIQSYSNENNSVPHNHSSNERSVEQRTRILWNRKKYLLPESVTLMKSFWTSPAIADADDTIPNAGLQSRFRKLAQNIQSNQKSLTRFRSFTYISETKQTRQDYKLYRSHLNDLSTELSHHLPKSFQGLQDSIQSMLSDVFPMKKDKPVEGPANEIGFCGLYLTDVIQMWLLLPETATEIHNQNALLEEVWLAGKAGLLQKAAELERDTTFVPTHPWEAPSIFETMALTYDLWYETALNALSQGHTVLIVPLDLFFDGFQIGSAAGAPKPNNCYGVLYVSSSIFPFWMKSGKLSPSVWELAIAYKSYFSPPYNPDAILKRYTDEAQKLARGVYVDVDGEKILIVSFLHRILGDLPARRDLLGQCGHRSDNPCPNCTFSFSTSQVPKLFDIEQGGTDEPRTMLTELVHAAGQEVCVLL